MPFAHAVATRLVASFPSGAGADLRSLSVAPALALWVGALLSGAAGSCAALPADGAGAEAAASSCAPAPVSAAGLCWLGCADAADAPAPLSGAGDTAASSSAANGCASACATKRGGRGDTPRDRATLTSDEIPAALGTDPTPKTNPRCARQPACNQRASRPFRKTLCFQWLAFVDENRGRTSLPPPANSAVSRFPTGPAAQRARDGAAPPSHL